MGQEISALLARREGETPQDHYRRLVEYRAELESTFRSVKGEAAIAEKERELERRHKRDRKKLGLDPEEKVDVEAEAPAS